MMELSWVVFVILILVPVNRVAAFVGINTTSETTILSTKSSTLNNGSITLNQKIKECDCGFASNGCHLVNGKKVCDCDFWMAQDGEECKYCDCGVLSKKCYFKNGKRFCDCLPGTAQTSYDSCEWCDCGYRSTGCVYKGYDKVCTCSVGSVQKYGKCEECDCGYGSISCSFSYGDRKCTCIKGYISKTTSKYSDEEKCEMYVLGDAHITGWRVATYVESFIFLFIIVSLIVFIKKGA